MKDFAGAYTPSPAARAGSGHIPAAKTQLRRTSFELPAEMMTRLKTVCAQEGMPMRRAVTEALAAWLEDHEREGRG